MLEILCLFLFLALLIAVKIWFLVWAGSFVLGLVLGATGQPRQYQIQIHQET